MKNLHQKLPLQQPIQQQLLRKQTVSETPTTTPSSERVILGIEDMSRTIGMALAGFGAIMLTALIWLYLRSKKA